MVRNVDYETRRRAVLAATINRYIKDALPVSSEEIAKNFDLSSATIRNIFAELEDTGYLTHPHTSGGRIPTDKGYRYYVDFLLSQIEILDEERECIVKEYEREAHRLEDILDKTSEIISMVTHYAGICSFLDWKDKFFYKGISFILEQPEFHHIDRIRLLLKMFEEKQSLLNIINRDFKEKVKIYIGKELDCAEIEDCSLAISSYRIKSQPKGRIAVLGPKRLEYKHIIPVLEFISEVLTETLDKIKE